MLRSSWTTLEIGTTVNVVELIRKYSQDRSTASLQELYAAIRAEDTYNPSTDIDNVVLPAMQRRDYQAVVDAVQAESYGIYMSPGIHKLAANSYRKLGDERSADFHDFFAQLAYQAIMSSGDGTLSRPWRVLRIRDEYDIMAIEGFEVDKQELVEQGSTRIDILTSGDTQKAFALDF